MGKASINLKSLLTISALSVAATTLLSMPVYAEPQVDLDSLKAQLATLREKTKQQEAPNLPPNPSSEMKQIDSDLKAAEEALLQKMNGSTPQAPAAQPAVANQGFNSPAEMQNQPVQSNQFNDQKAVELAKERARTEELAAEKAKLSTRITVQKKQISSLSNNNKGLNKQLKDSEKRIAELKKELKKAQDRLIFAETEVERLSSIVDQRHRSTLAKFSGKSAKASEARASMRSDVNNTRGESDMEIATVAVKKANLRAGPGKDHSILLTVSAGSRLAIERKQGEWYRVMAPNGKRAWIHASIVVFPTAGMRDPSRTLRVRGYDSGLESAAVSRLRDRRD